MRHVLAALFSLLSLPLFLFGGKFLVSALKLRSGQPFYTSSSPEDFLAYGAIWVGIALLALVPSVLVLLKKSAPSGLLVLPLLVLVLSAIAIPSNMPPGYRGTMAGRAVERRMKLVATALEQWGGEHGQLPGDDGQLRDALKTNEPPDEDSATNSRYHRGGQPVPYRFILASNALAPHRLQPAGDQPAIVYCAISSDRKRFWLTATALPGDVSSQVVMLGRDGELVVINGEVPAKPSEPAATAAPEKKSKKGAPPAK